MSIDIQKRTEYFLKDLHAREYMRLGCSRQMTTKVDKVEELRERKARHEAFLRDLLRKRGISPFWYARVFYIFGHIFGVVAARLPKSWVRLIEYWMEFWILMRYEKYLQEMHFDAALRSMVEAIQLKKMTHNEPQADTIEMLRLFVEEQQSSLQRFV